ncbi:protein SSUH2 homolog [Exaiptasia diaphana]|uniref:Protein SSUH2 homolog n=1 Tax=Exaiptasia diaphana TaxID=2652724 RepID=A0A913YNM9_EXADI|nr:protein SSUH2 homolog [Exaiptasia diaphana]
MSGYPPQQGPYPGQPNQPPVGFAPQYGAPPQQGGYPPQGGPPQQHGGYPPPQGSYQQGGLPPQQQGYPPQQGGYQPQQGGYPPQQGGYPPQQGGAQPQKGYGATNLSLGGDVDTPTYTGSDIPDQDVEGNDNAGPPAPSAPPPSLFGPLPGYENMNYGTPFLPPPPAYEPPKQENRPEQHFSQATSITDDQARNALLKFAGDHCCYGKGAAKDMDIKDIQPTCAYHYSLTSFCEGRATAYAFQPYTGQPIDGPNNGPPPPPWSIPANPPKNFQDATVKIEVPHTAVLKPCHECFGGGYKRCYNCHGRGRTRCSSCHGSGHRSVYRDGEHHQEHCTWCHGSGRRRCMKCHGHGRVRCWTCNGQGNLKTYIELTVKWVNHISNHVVERTDLPNELIVGSQGTEIFNQELPRVWPITGFHDNDVNIGSKQLVDQHATNFPSERMLLQRHVLRAVPVSEVHYEWKDHNSRYWVYGHDHKVHAPDYPQTCCCGCTIL